MVASEKRRGDNRKSGTDTCSAATREVCMDTDIKNMCMGST